MRRTTIFLPEKLHQQLREAAFRAKISMAELIRERLRGSTGHPKRRAASQDPLLKVAGICRGPILSAGIDKALYGG